MSFRRFPKKKAAVEYNNISSTCALGHSHRSKLESSVCQILQLREKAGEICAIEAEVRVLICGPDGHECDHKQKIESIVDFRFMDPVTKAFQYAEAKGFESPQWPLKRRLWMHNRVETLEVWKGSHKRPQLAEVIFAKRGVSTHG